jgi:hypothetical protein
MREVRRTRCRADFSSRARRADLIASGPAATRRAVGIRLLIGRARKSTLAVGALRVVGEVCPAWSYADLGAAARHRTELMARILADARGTTGIRLLIGRARKGTLAVSAIGIRLLILATGESTGAARAVGIRLLIRSAGEGTVAARAVRTAREVGRAWGPAGLLPCACDRTDIRLIDGADASPVDACGRTWARVTTLTTVFTAGLEVHARFESGEQWARALGKPGTAVEEGAKTRRRPRREAAAGSVKGHTAGRIGGATATDRCSSGTRSETALGRSATTGAGWGGTRNLADRTGLCLDVLRL